MGSRVVLVEDARVVEVVEVFEVRSVRSVEVPVVRPLAPAILALTKAEADCILCILFFASSNQMRVYLVTGFTTR